MPMRLRKNTRAVSAAARTNGKCAVRPWVLVCTMWKEKKKEHESASRLRNAWVTYGGVHIG